MYVCVISITQKQITAETSNLVFYVCIKNTDAILNFYEDQTKTVYRGTQNNSNILHDLWTEFVSAIWYV